MVQMECVVEGDLKLILDVTAPSEQMDTTDAFLNQANTLKTAEHSKDKRNCGLCIKCFNSLCPVSCILT